MNQRTLSLKYESGTLRHLGSQMYGGGLVKPMAELIANAWDADATRVEITLPTRQNPTAVMADNGKGMSFEECQEHYLTIGRDRRAASKTDLTASGRKVMGRKGVGKLAVIQVSPEVEIETVAMVEHEGEPVYWLTRFRIPYGEYLNTDGAREDVIEVLEDGHAPDTLLFPDGSRTGTRTTLRHVQLAKMPNPDEFRDSMHLRFALDVKRPRNQDSDEIALTSSSQEEAGSREVRDTFQIFVNGKAVPTVEEAIKAAEYEFEFKGEEQVEGVGAVSWWLGYTAEPQKKDERLGIGVYARGRIAVERPFYFNLSKGFTGQLSKEYMTGIVRVDAIDDDQDLIATDRGSINWSHDVGQALEKWGQSLIMDHAKEWQKKRGERKIKDLKPDKRYMEMIGKLGDRPKQQAKALLQRLAAVPDITKEEIDHTAKVILNGLEHYEFQQTLAEMAEAEIDQLPEVLKRWEVLEALLYLPVVKSRIDVIRTLEKYVEGQSREFPDIFNHLKENPELLRPEWLPLKWNAWMSTIVDDLFKKDRGPDQTRPDVLCLSDSNHFVIVELKRPGHTVTQAEAVRFLDYVGKIGQEAAANTDWKDARVEGVLVCDKLDDGATYVLNRNSGIARKSWNSFLEDARRAHAYILERVATKVPHEDPRVAPYLPKDEAPIGEAPALVEGGLSDAETL